MKYYIPLRCPNCGETQFSKIQRPDSCSNSLSENAAFEVKWGKCDTCNEIVPIPRSHIVKE